MSIFITDEGYFPVLPLSEINKDFVTGLKSWKKIDICPACTGISISRFATIKEMPYSRCNDCGLKFANPIPSEEVINAFYNSAFYSNYRRLEERYLEHEKYFSVSIKVQIMYHLATWLGNDKFVKILDYGCGPGSFLALLRDKFGFSNVEGIELNKDSLRVAKSIYGLNLHSTTEELRSKLYDYIILIEVIEHIPKPDIFLEHISSLLKPGGSILISTPAVDNPISIFLPSHSDAPFTSPCHVSLFTKKALTRLLNRFNFNIEYIEISKSWNLVEKIITSIFYDQDFLSPRHDNDFNDFLYTPTSVGKRLGLKPQRDLSPIFWVFRPVDIIFAQIASRSRNLIPTNGHMYVLARKGV